MKNDIEAKSFKLLDSLEIHDVKSNISPHESSNERKYKGRGVSEILRIEDDNFISGNFYDTNPQTNKKSVKVRFNNKYIVLSEDKYEILTEIIYLLFTINFFTSYATYEFLEDKIITWIIKCCSEKRITISLIDFLCVSIDENSKEYIFYFIVDSLVIEKPFDLGTIEITYLTDEMISNEYEKLRSLRETSKEEISDFFKEYQSAIIAKTKVKGINKKASLVAKDRVTLALSVFKLFFSRESVNDYYQMFDVNFRSKRLSTYTYIYESSINQFDFNEVLEVRHGASPIIINDNVLKRINSEHIFVLLGFISNYKSNELNEIIISSINDLADSFSIRNFHERVSKLVSFFEGILLPKSHRKGEGETYLKNNLLSKMNLSERDVLYIKRLIRIFYEMRHKYLHNRIELPIDLNQLDTFQYIAVKFVFLLINKSATISTLDGLHSYLNIKSQQ